MSLNVAIVGCGFVGRKRAAVLRNVNDNLVVVVDVVGERARNTAEEYGCHGTNDWRPVVDDPDIDIVVVSTTNQYLHAISLSALNHGKHVLCEKPLGRNPAEVREIVETGRKTGRVLKAGFNHRHHPAIQQAREAAISGRLGKLMFIRCVYGHGGRAGYEKEWRGDIEQAGGGEMLDQGIHALDLCRWFLGEFVQVNGITRRFFWKIDPLEDNGFALLQTADGRVASIHASWTQWKNRFSFEVFGDEGYASIEGLGGTYGTETLTLGRRSRESGPPVVEQIVFEGGDDSWKKEWLEFRKAIDQGGVPLGSGEDGLAAVQLVDAVYRSSLLGGAPVRVAIGERGRDIGS
ncbi:MAG: Gfo/Idh/MocA family oxidoreductase [Acidobacteria bacterium]|nr:Gfo/Idh/MocA family oxidoreductase [Acidobacteriota bacterium]